ncbi:hypothetical protein BS47DRAFT_1486522 [Hydnum rufescens UP504]|uniref:ADP/ATP carrier receptor n=1 Tax=Hydnum rufescens UP504 TaxID=1448309 RepID=A0A9P6AV99_9AGAM|nr:hypothetical protein BS47DRAFT_1486522 [Hydnum rufescens UP504]
MASDSSSEGLLSRAQNLVSENRRAIVVGAVAALAITGAGYYLYATRPEEEGSKKKKNKDKDSPILEERTPPSVEPRSETEDESPRLTKTEIEALPETERFETANKFKIKGNAAYQARKFTQAVDLYTQAIEISPHAEAVYFSNRAACYVNFSPPQYELVVRDCDEALKRDPAYLKALNRRANALEALNRLHEALRDFTTATILDKFQNDAAGASLERVLKKIAQAEARQTISTREPQLPSFTFIYAYLAAFRPRPLPVLPAEPSQGDRTLLLAYEALEAQDYAHSCSLANEAIEQGISWDLGKAEGFNLRGTFKFLTGNSLGARDDLEAALAIIPGFIQVWVKVASVHMELGNTEATFAAFASALSHNPDDPDIYYHRGQVNFILQQFKEAEADYVKSTALDSTFVFSHIQLAVAQYKTEQTAASMATFRRTMKAFPQRSEPQNYYGELLLDQRRFSDAVEKFDRAIELERQKCVAYFVVLTRLTIDAPHQEAYERTSLSSNKALTIYQWQQDLPAAERLLREALKIDPDCDSAIATLAQLTLQQGRLDDAVELFSKHASIARTEPELEQALTFKYATAAQRQFLKEFPHMASQMSQLAHSMMQQQ